MSKEMPEIDPLKVEQFAAQGMTVKQIADCCDVSRSYFYDQMKKVPDVKDAIKRGRSKGIGVVTNSLFQSAKGGNVTAQIFYLKNRQPDKWRDRRQHEHSGADGKPIEIDNDVHIHIHDPRLEEADDDGAAPSS